MSISAKAMAQANLDVLEANQLSDENSQQIEKKALHILYIDDDSAALNYFRSSISLSYENQFTITSFKNGYQAFQWLSSGNFPDAIICEYSLIGMSSIQFLRLLKSSDSLRKTPFFFISNKSIDKKESLNLLREGVDDFFLKPLQVDSLIYRLKYLFKIKNFDQSKSLKNTHRYKIQLAKRAFDIVMSGFALILLSPLFLIVAIIIKLESKGTVFYKSKRVGMGYQIFDLYKFRSMASGADKSLEKLKHLNLYQNQDDDETSKTADETTQVPTDETNGIKDDSNILIADHTVYSESEYQTMQKNKNASIFMKFKDDPRVTKFGRFIRNTSIDELPQLINVLIGDISIVGNRPLPLYEAEKLTTDSWMERFMAPAGITGLWQVTKRGKSDMSEEERIALDNHYARNCSFWFDIKIILKTFPALLQTENV